MIITFKLSRTHIKCDGTPKELAEFVLALQREEEDSQTALQAEISRNLSRLVDLEVEDD